jgi:hypothetical protein
LPEKALQGVYWKVIGWYFLLGIALSINGAIVGSLASGLDPHLTGVAMLSRSIPLVAMAVIGYLAVILSLNVVLRVYLLRDAWEKVLQSVRVENIAWANEVAAKGDLANALGEGFADGLDVAAF